MTLLTLAEVAARLRVSKTTAWRRIKCGDIGAFRDGNVLRVPDVNVDAYIAARTAPNKSVQTPSRPAR